jgi:uncharacterized protein Yka (UPF0111/DUF47 family)
MQEARFDTDWESHPRAREIAAKYERFADLIKERVHNHLFLNRSTAKDSLTSYLKQ